MFARIEVVLKPELIDPAANRFLRKVELMDPSLRQKIRWARSVQIYWLDLECTREELIIAVGEVFWDRVLQWLLTGNLIPSAAGKFGTIQDILQFAPIRPGKFWGLERRYRNGVTDNAARTTIEAIEIVLKRKIPAARAASGELMLLEGAQLTEDELSRLSKQIFCNELIETSTIQNEAELIKNDRFHQERIKHDFRRVVPRISDRVDTFQLGSMSDSELESLSESKLLALNLKEMQAIRDFFEQPDEKVIREQSGLTDLTDVELEVLAQTWSEHCKHKIFNAEIRYSEPEGATEEGKQIPAKIDSLFQSTIAGTTREIEKPWLLSVFSDNAGVVAFDEEDAVCIKVETHNSPSALDPYGGALTGILGVNRDILGTGIGAKPIFNTDVFCVTNPDYNEPLPDRLMHPRRILEGVRSGVETGGNTSGIPTINGALVFDDRFLGKPLVFCGSGGRLPRKHFEVASTDKTINVGDRICMVGGRIGKDGIHGATFSSLALTDSSPISAVQLGDPITQRRVTDFLIEARDLGLYRTLTDNGAGGLSSSVGELAQLSGGARMDVSLAKTKYLGLKPYELVISESQERMTCAVPPLELTRFLELAERRGVEVSVLGEFTSSGRFEIFYAKKCVANLNLKFMHRGVPKLEINAEWIPTRIESKTGSARITDRTSETLAAILSRPNICSKEWMISQYDHEVQGTSVIKPLTRVQQGSQRVGASPNDAGVVALKSGSTLGVVVSCGINPKFSDIDPYLMAQMVVDEAVRNALAAGAEFGTAESVLALVDNFCWADPTSDPRKAAALVRACYGMREAALALQAPFISGKDSMKNDFKGMRKGEPVTISVPGTLLVTALGRIRDLRRAHSADFKNPGDAIYLLGAFEPGLIGSEYQLAGFEASSRSRLPKPNWPLALKAYFWLGGAVGTHQGKIRALHDISDGGLAVALAEMGFARDFGVDVDIPAESDPTEFCFGESFHSFVASVAETDTAAVEAEWKEWGVPFIRLGRVSNSDLFKLNSSKDPGLTVQLRKLKEAWERAGYWQ